MTDDEEVRLGDESIATVEELNVDENCTSDRGKNSKSGTVPDIPGQLEGKLLLERTVQTA